MNVFRSKKNLNKFVFSVLLLLGSFLYVYGTQADTLRKLTPNFRFADGIFLSFEQVKYNAPISKAKLLTTLPYDSRDFFEQALSKPTISFYDNVGARKQVSVNALWGYAQNGILYINYNNTFNRITVVGALCHFVANYTTTTSVYDPYYYGTYGHFGYSPVNSYQNTELRQYALDFKTGKVFDYTSHNLAIVLMNDPELHDEYEKLRNRKKKQLKFYYLRKYNERNPVYIHLNTNKF